jgi:hypothetical protein
MCPCAARRSAVLDDVRQTQSQDERGMAPTGCVPRAMDRMLIRTLWHLVSDYVTNDWIQPGPRQRTTRIGQSGGNHVSQN